MAAKILRSVIVGASTLFGKELSEVLNGAELARDGGRGYWLWMAADNLKLAARHAVTCGAEFAALRPRSMFDSSGQLR